MPILGILASSRPAFELVGSYDSLATVTVPSGGVASVTFAGIPSGYKHLQIRSIQRNLSPSGSGIQIGLTQFNGDTGTNYSRHNLVGNGSTATASAAATVNGVWLGVMPQTGDTANAYGASIMDILDYADTNKFKTTRSLEGLDLNGSGEANFRSGSWRSTSAITSITITPTLYSFEQYTTFALYGVR